jgi:hypothetical protein
MKKHFPLLLFIAAILTACNNNSRQTPEETQPSGLNDATRNFIRAALDGDFDKAKSYMIVDTPNVHYLNFIADRFKTMDKPNREGYQTASIIIHSSEEKIKDSLAIVIYSNSYMNNHDTLRVLKQNNNWLVDLKYLYEHDFELSTDTTAPRNPVNIEKNPALKQRNQVDTKALKSLLNDNTK